MSDVQIAVIDQQDTQIVLAVPGVQGATGSSIPSGGTTDQVLRKNSSTDYDANWAQVTSAMIANGTIVNDDINNSAAIAGTKISPDFGGQAVTTTGQVSAARVNVTNNTPPSNGLYLPSANNVAISTGGSGRLFVDSSGYVSIGTTNNPAAAQLMVTKIGGAQGFEFLPGSSTTVNTILNYDRAGSAYLTSAVNALDHIWQTSGTERLRITSAGLVGVGTSSPQGRFESAAGDSSSFSIVANNANSTGDANYISLVSGTTQIGSIIRTANDIAIKANYASVSFWTGTSGTATQKAVIDSSGRLGIGTTSPSATVHANSGSASDVYFRSSNSLATSSLGTAADGSTYVYNSAAYPVTFSTNATERARIDSSGRLLVGTSMSRVVEDLLGNGPQGLIQIEATNSDAIMSIISAGTADAGRAGTLSLGRHRNSTVGGTPTIVQDGDTLGAICFAGGDGTDMRTKGASIAAQVDGSPGVDVMPGRLVFSSTKGGSASPDPRVRINNVGNVALCADGEMLYGTTTLAAGTTSALVDLYSGGTVGSFGSGTRRFLIFTNGNVQNSTGSFTQLSDAKLKENIVDANSQWADIKSIRIRNWNFKAETGHETHRQIGPIAQELEQVCPGLVYETPDRDADGNDLGTVTKGINQSIMYMKAVKALQEAMERIEQLEQRLADAGIN